MQSLAFSTSIPLRTTRGRAAALFRPHAASSPCRNARPCIAMTSPTDLVREDIVRDDAPRPAERKPALPVPPFVLTTPLLSALYELFSGRTPPDVALLDALVPDAEWETPFFAVDSRDEAASLLDSFLAFSIDSAFCVHHAEQVGKELRFEWTLSYTYPLPWRPRVAVSGRSFATLQAGLALRVEDDWNVSPLSLVAQSLPIASDFIWLWPSPHAESDRGSRRLLRRGRGYKIFLHAARPEFRIVKALADYERELVWATPALPEEAFEGDLRKKELYSTITPISVRQVGDAEIEWAVAVPGSLFGSSEVLAKAPTAENATIICTDERKMAVTRFRGYATREVVQERLKRLLEALVADDVIQDESHVNRASVWVRSYDSKVGFNSNGILSMAMYASSVGIPRLNELAVELTNSNGMEHSATG